jgi:hypothetical protein
VLTAAPFRSGESTSGPSGPPFLTCRGRNGRYARGLYLFCLGVTPRPIRALGVQPDGRWWVVIRRRGGQVVQSGVGAGEQPVVFKALGMGVSYFGLYVSHTSQGQPHIDRTSRATSPARLFQQQW